MKAKDVISALIAAVVFVSLLFVAGWNFLAALGVSVVLYFGLSFLLTPVRRIGGVDVETMKNGPELEQTFDEAEKDLRTVEAAAGETNSQQIREGARQLVKTGRSILTYLQTHVDKIPQARRFLNYYLDSAGDILTRYVAFENTGAPYQDMEQVRANTLSALRTLNDTFSSQYSRLLAGEVMNMDVDVEVLKKMAQSDRRQPFTGGEVMSSQERRKDPLEGDRT